MPKVSAPTPTPTRLPCFGSLQNNSTSEYRYDRVTYMKKKFVLPDCLFKFELIDLNKQIYAIRNVKNNEYLQNTIQTMAKKVVGTGQQWQFTPSGNGFYIQNVQNQEYLTSRAGHLASASGKNVPGAEQVYNVGSQCS